MKFTKLLYDVKCSNKMVLYTGMTAVVLVNQDMKKQPALKFSELLCTEFLV